MIMVVGANEANRLVAALRQAFLARRPVRTASLIVTLFGDVVVPRGGVLSIRALVDLMGAVGIEPGAVRTAMSRLVADGLFRKADGGRRPRYALSAEAERSFAEAFRRVYAGERPVTGAGFRLLILPGTVRKAADETAFAGAGYRGLAPGVWVAPASAPDIAVPPGAFPFTAGTDAATTRRVAEEALGLGRTQEAYRDFAREFGPFAESAAAAGPADAFALRLLAVHSFRRAVIHDPNLPEDLLPPERPDRAARQVMANLYATLVAASEVHVAAVAAADDEPLAPLTINLSRRFVIR